MHRRCVTVGMPLLLLLALPACGGGEGASPLELTHVPTTDLGLVPAGTLVIRTTAAWLAFWDAHPYPRGAVPAPPVDFERHAVAGVFAGSKPRCQRLEIASGERLDGVVTLRWRIVTFGQARLRRASAVTSSTTTWRTWCSFPPMFRMYAFSKKASDSASNASR